MLTYQMTHQANHQAIPVSIESTATGWAIQAGDASLEVLSSQLMPTGAGQGVWTLNGQRLPYAVAQTQTHVYVWLNGQTATFEKPQPKRRSGGGAGAAGGEAAVKANMPGKVLQVLVAEGDLVSVGDAAVIVESMKMEMTLNAAVAGTVKAVNAVPDAMVEIGQVLVDIEPQD